MKWMSTSIPPKMKSALPGKKRSTRPSAGRWRKRFMRLTASGGEPGGGGGSLMHLCMVNLSPSSSLGLHPASGSLETPVPVGVHPPGGGNPGARASPGKGDLGLQLLLVTAQVPLVLLQPRHLRGVTGVGAADVRGDGRGGGTAGQLVPPTLDALPGPEGVEPGALVLLLVLPAKG